MATRYNPYAMDANLSAGISNLTKALIGSAQDDAAIARAKASMASAGASNALTKLRNEQIKGEALTNALMGDFNKNKEAFLGSDEAVRGFYNMLGIPDPVVETPKVAPVGGGAGAVDSSIASAMGINPNENVVPYIERSTQPVPMDAMRGLVGTMFGNQKSNMQQASAGMGNIQELAKNNLIRNLLLSSNQDPSRMAMIMQGKSPGQFFDQGSAERFAEITSQTKKDVQEIKETGLTERHIKGLENGISIEKIRQSGLIKRQKSQLLTDKYIANLEIQHKEKISKMELALKEEMARLKIAEETKTEKLIAEKKLEQKTANDQKKLELEKEIAELKEANRVKIAKMTDATKKWEFKNRTLTATYDEVLIVSEEYAIEKGIAKQTEGRYKGLYIIDGGQDPSKKMVKLNANQTVYMTEELANDFGIDVNAQGQFKAEGMKTKDPTKDSQIALDKFAEQFQNDIEVFTAEGELPNNHVMGQMRTAFYNNAKELMETGNMSWADAYNQTKGEMLTGTTEIGGGMISSGEFVPNFILDRAIALEIENKFTVNMQKAYVRNLSEKYKYNEDVIEGILEYVASESLRRRTVGN